jgi:F-type H+-transporting ATPase subunit delta
MVTGSVARRYAKALFGLAVESGHVEQWGDALHTLGQVLDSTPELSDALASPAYGREQRRDLVRQLAATLSLDAEPANLLFLLGDRNRLGQLGGVIQAFTTLADGHLGRVRARVTSATAVDPAHVGGVVAQVGNLVYDGSVRTQLEDLRATLKR